jgi:hydrogenase maturation protease
MSSRCVSERQQGKPGEPQVPLVVGMGNPMAADDAIGVELVRRLRHQSHTGCRFLEVTQPGLGLLRLFDQASWILFVDAVVSGAPPGTVCLIPLPSKLVESRGIASLSSHGLGLAEVTELCQVLGRPMPRMFLLGIEIGDATLGASRTESVDRAMRDVVSGFPSLVKLLSTSAPTLWTEPHRYSPEQMRFVPCSIMVSGEISTRP